MKINDAASNLNYQGVFVYGYESSLELQDGGLEVVIAAPDLPWLASLVLSFTTWATVLDPPELRDMVRDWAQATADQYQ